MHFEITALTNTKAELIASKSFTDDMILADVIRDKYLDRGLIVVVETETDEGEKTARRYIPSEQQVSDAEVA